MFGGKNTRKSIMDFLIGFLAHAGCIFGLIAVHECGHYLAGWVGGIPARDMSIRLLTFPQHVALRSEDRWVSPMELEPYLATMWKHLVTTPRLFLYTAGGHLLETLVTTVTVIALVQLGWPKVAFMVAMMSTFLVGIGVLVMDLPLAWLRGHPFGDVSGLWRLAKLPTVGLVLLLFAVRILLLWYATVSPNSGNFRGRRPWSSELRRSTVAVAKFLEFERFTDCV